MYRSFICNVKYFIKLLNNSKIKKNEKITIDCIFKYGFRG